jgi:hypothetical protein
LQHVSAYDAGDFGGSPERYLLALVKSDGNVRHHIALVECQVTDPLVWNGQSHPENSKSLWVSGNQQVTQTLLTGG